MLSHGDERDTSPPDRFVRMTCHSTDSRDNLSDCAGLPTRFCDDDQKSASECRRCWSGQSLREPQSSTKLNERPATAWLQSNWKLKRTTEFNRFWNAVRDQGVGRRRAIQKWSLQGLQIANRQNRVYEMSSTLRLPCPGWVSRRPRPSFRLAWPYVRTALSKKAARFGSKHPVFRKRETDSF
jgi:hypothetical protein